jgi:hypothetical protein
MHPKRPVRDLHAARGKIPRGELSSGPLLPARGEEVNMSAVAVEIMGSPRTETSDEIEFVPDIDAFSSTAVNLGCGDDKE